MENSVAERSIMFRFADKKIDAAPAPSLPRLGTTV
jgi:hypothetical protein